MAARASFVSASACFCPALPACAACRARPLTVALDQCRLAGVVEIAFLMGGGDGGRGQAHGRHLGALRRPVGQVGGDVGRVSGQGLGAALVHPRLPGGPCRAVVDEGVSGPAGIDRGRQGGDLAGAQVDLRSPG